MLARAVQPPATPRSALYLGPHLVGSVAAAFATFCADARLGDEVVRRLPDGSWLLADPPQAALAALAQAMRAHRWAQVHALWRDELLAVRDAHGHALCRVERGAVRALGLATQAVYLHATTPDGRVWVQQRALSKATDPGLWDTVMGGMVSADDTVVSALAREVAEETGLALASFQGLAPGGHFVQRWPHTMDGGAGYLVERIDWYAAVLPDGVQPQPTDGEVAQFAAYTPAQLVPMLHAGAFTPEASLILSRAVFGLAYRLPA